MISTIRFHPSAVRSCAASSHTTDSAWPNMILEDSWIDDFFTNAIRTGRHIDWPRVAFSRKRWTAEDQRVGTRRAGLTSSAHAADSNTNRTETRTPRGEIRSWRRSPSLLVSRCLSRTTCRRRMLWRSLKSLNKQGRDDVKTCAIHARLGVLLVLDRYTSQEPKTEPRGDETITYPDDNLSPRYGL